MKSTTSRRRWLVIVPVLIALLMLAAYLLAPSIIKSQLEQRGSAELGRRVTVEKVKLNPFELSLTLEGFAIQERDGTQRFLGWNRLYVNFDALSSLWSEWVLSEIALDGFNARVALNADQSFNFSDVLAKLTAKPAAKPGEPGRPIRIATLKVGQAQVAFSDASRPQPFATTLGPLTFSLTGFRTISERGAPYRFEAITEAKERLAWTGTLQAEPLRSIGQLAIENIVLAKYAPYYADRIQGDLVAGTLSLKGEYELNLAPQQRMMQLREGAFQLRGIKLVERANQESALELPELAVTGVHADALTLKATVASVVLNGGHVRARREKDGSINLLTIVTPPKAPAPPTAPPAVGAPPVAPGAKAAKPDVVISELAVKDFKIDLVDLAAPRPVQLALSNIELSLKNVTLAEGAQIPLQLALTWAPQGTLRVGGTVAIAPVKADLKIDVGALDLLPLSPYLEQFVDAKLTRGTATATLQAQVALPDGQPPAASVEGDVQVEKLGLVDAAHNEELAGFSSLQLRGLRAATAPAMSAALEEINLAGPFARVILRADKTLNLASALRLAPAPPATETGAAPAPVTSPAATPATVAEAAPKAAEKPALKLEIGKIAISEGDYRFTDQSIQPNVRMAIGQFGGTLTGLSSAAPGRGQVDLKALVDGAGEIAIAGKLDPLGPKPAVDLKIDFKNVDLLPLSAYSGKFAGYELARGKLVVDVKVAVDGKKIDSANVITLNQFTFGSPVASPEATKLPVRLGVALLKDADGKIVIDVPVQGDLDDPSFKIGGVVLRVVVNLLTKAAMSPFTLLGAAFGGGDELAFQEFGPGSAELQPAGIKKLETMVKALTNRPALSVALEGNYDAAADTYALKRAKLADQVRRAVWEQKRQTDPNIAPPAELVISAEENVALIKKLYDEKFPPGTEFGAPVAPPPPVVAAPPPPPAGIYQRIKRVITRQAAKEKTVADQEAARLAGEHAKAVEAAKASGLPFEEMNARLAEAIAIDENDLRALAEARAQRVRDYFAKTGGIAADRLFLAKASTEPAPAPAAAPAEGGSTIAGATGSGKGPRVFLSLQ